MKISKLNKYKKGDFELKPKHIYAKNKLSLIANKIIKKLNLLELKGGSEDHKKIRGELSNILNDGLNTIKPDDIIDSNSNTISDTLTLLTQRMKSLVNNTDFKMNNIERGIFDDIIRADTELVGIFNILTELLGKSPNSFEPEEQALLKKHLFNIQKGLFNLQIKIIFRKIQKIDKVKFSPILEIIDKKITLMNDFIDKAYDDDANTPRVPIAPKIDTWVSKLQNYLYYKIYKYMKAINIVTQVTMSGTLESYLGDIKQIINDKIIYLSFATLDKTADKCPDLSNIDVNQFMIDTKINDVITTYNTEFLDNKDTYKIDTYAKLNDLLTESNDIIIGKKQTSGTELTKDLNDLIEKNYNDIVEEINRQVVPITGDGVEKTKEGDDGSPFRNIHNALTMSIEDHLKILLPYILEVIGKIALKEVNRVKPDMAVNNTEIYETYVKLNPEEKIINSKYFTLYSMIIETFINISGLGIIDNNNTDNTININNKKITLKDFIDEYNIKQFVDYFNLRIPEEANKFSYNTLKEVLTLISSFEEISTIKYIFNIWQ